MQLAKRLYLYICPHFYGFRWYFPSSAPRKTNRFFLNSCLWDSKSQFDSYFSIFNLFSRPSVVVRWLVSAEFLRAPSLHKGATSLRSCAFNVGRLKLFGCRWFFPGAEDLGYEQTGTALWIEVCWRARERRDHFHTTQRRHYHIGQKNAGLYSL